MVGMGGAAVGSFLWWAWDVVVQKWNGGDCPSGYSISGTGP